MSHWALPFVALTSFRGHRSLLLTSVFPLLLSFQTRGQVTPQIGN